MDTPPTSEEIARFMRYVQKLPCGCWFWLGARSRGRGNKQHYGSFRYRGKTIRAHVFSHDELAGKVCPPAWHRDHECRFSLCVNPDHVNATPPEHNQARVREHDLITLARMAVVEGGGDVHSEEGPSRSRPRVAEASAEMGQEDLLAASQAR